MMVPKICELVGLYISSILGKVCGIQNVGLYRDDGLACLEKISGPATDKIRKDIIRTFRENFGLKITITTNLKTVNFLDVTFNLCTRKYRATHLLVSMSTQTIRLISSRHCQIIFQNE